MEQNQNTIDNFQEVVNRKEKVISIPNNNNNLYLNSHQIRWFKGSRNRGLRSDTVA